jgi:hypothetical protein
MIDRFLYNFFGWIDSLFEKVDEVLTFKFPKSKKNKYENKRKY